jgi:hypothetical protein
MLACLAAAIISKRTSDCTCWLYCRIFRRADDDDIHAATRILTKYSSRTSNMLAMVEVVFDAPSEL